LTERDNAVNYAMSNFTPAHEKLLAFVVAIFVLSLGEIAGDLGKLWGMLRSPARKSSSHI
jgi:hypothetical protein